MRRIVKKRGQVWVETVIYTLIGLAVIGLVLATAKPKIDAKRDEMKINQAIDSLRNINDKINEVQIAKSNSRKILLTVGSGEVIIDIERDEISWKLDSSFEYSEDGITIQVGDVNVTTTKSSPWSVELLMSYGVDIRVDNITSGTKEFTAASTPYELIVRNIGDSNGNIVVDIREI